MLHYFHCTSTNMNLGGVIHLNKTGVCIVCGCIFILFLYIFSKSNHKNPTTDQVNGVNLKDLLKLSISAAEAGGALILTTNNAKIETKGKTKEGANESVTSADFRSHCAMTGLLKRSVPPSNIVSEEEKATCGNFILEEVSTNFDEDVNNLKDSFVNLKDITVWVDPLDATQEYTEALHQYVTTMVCVAIKEKPIIGVIHKPYSKETYWGWVGNGKSSNLINNTPEKETNIIVISRSHSGNKIQEIVKQKLSDYSVVQAGGSGYKVLEVVHGKADAYIHKTNIKKWDICAGNAILHSVDGQMTTWSGQNITYEDKSNPVNEDGLVASLKNQAFFLKQLYE